MQSRTAILKAQVQEIGEAFSLLENLDPGVVSTGKHGAVLGSPLILLDNLPSAQDLTHISTSCVIPNERRFQGQHDLVNTITKLRKYHTSRKFWLKASASATMFRNITVAESSFRNLGTKPSQPQSSPNV